MSLTPDEINSLLRQTRSGYAQERHSAFLALEAGGSPAYRGLAQLARSTDSYTSTDAHEALVTLAARYGSAAALDTLLGLATTSENPLTACDALLFIEKVGRAAERIVPALKTLARDHWDGEVREDAHEAAAEIRIDCELARRRGEADLGDREGPAV